MPTARVTILICVLGVSVVRGSAAQDLLDRVAARVDSNIILLSDVRAAVALGVIAAPAADPDRAGVELLIERQVILGEVARFPAPEPTELAVDELLATMKLRAGSQLGAMMAATGIDEPRIRALARDTLRIQAYIRQRFGVDATVNAPEVRQWIRDARGRATVVVG
jgi:hypothetical protein